MNYVRSILPRIALYRLARLGIAGPGIPINLTFSITNLCQSKCKTCGIWKIYKTDPVKYREELKLDEIEKIFRSIGRIFVFNISGGEPFLRTDITSIVEFACIHLSPEIVHIPTNAISSSLIEKKVREILCLLKKEFPSVQLTIKPSLDHIGEKHDEIRGVKGNFIKVMELFHSLRALKPDFPNLHVELGTVISAWNVGDIEKIADYVTALGVDSYRNEIAERRSEMFNREDAITPSPDDYAGAVGYFVGRIRANMKNRIFFQRATNAFRLVYYDLAVRILRENRQVIPCYAGLSNAHISPYGDVWACCTLGYEKSMGNLRDYRYDFKLLWNSRQADVIRDEIRRGSCNCPLANQAYSNILLHVPTLLKVIKKVLINR